MKLENLETDEISSDALNELIPELKTQIKKILKVPSYIEVNLVISNKNDEILLTS